MSEITIGRYDRIKRNAYMTRAVLDTPFRPDETTAKYLINHLHDCIENPTTGMIASHGELGSSYITNPQYYYKNKHLAFKLNPVKDMYKEFQIKLHQLYPKTLSAREFIIKTNRIVLNEHKFLKVKHDIRRLIFKLINI